MKEEFPDELIDKLSDIDWYTISGMTFFIFLALS